MTKADQAIDAAADRVATFVRDARSSGGIKAKLGDALAEDPGFIRKLKPSLVKARAKGQTPVDHQRGSLEAPSGKLGECKASHTRRFGWPWRWVVVFVTV
jgi:hypothetical protein